MQQYKLEPGAFKDFRKKYIILMVPSFAIATAIVIFMSSASWQDTADSLRFKITCASFAMLFALIHLYPFIKKQKKLFDRYTLTITEDAVIMERLNAPMVTINQRDIISITKGKNGTLIIQGLNKEDQIIVHGQIEYKEQIRGILESIVPLSDPVKFNKRATLIYVAPSILSLVTMILIYVLNDKIMVTISGLVFLVSWVLSYKTVRDSKIMGARTKRNRYAYIIVAILVLAKAISVWFNLQQYGAGR